MQILFRMVGEIKMKDEMIVKLKTINSMYGIKKYGGKQVIEPLIKKETKESSKLNKIYISEPKFKWEK